MSENNKVNNNDPKVPLHGSVKYPVDARIVPYFRLTPDGSVTPDFKNISKHFNAANNLRVLKDMAESGIIRPEPLAEGDTEDVKEAAVDQKDEIPSYQKVDESDIKDLESDPQTKQIAELIKKNPTESRKFEDYINNQAVNDDPSLMATYAMLTDVMGITPVRQHKNGESKIVHSPPPNHQMVHELAGLVNEELEEKNDQAASGVVDGLNRALNIFIMQKGVKKSLANESAEDILRDFVTFLYDSNEFRKILSYYRKAGNHRYVDEEGKPSPKKPERNNRYVWLGVPHGDDYFSDQAIEDMAELRKKLDRIMDKAVDPEGGSEKVRVEVLEPSLAANVNPVKGAMAGVVMKIGNQAMHFDKALKEKPKGTTKNAGDSLKAKATSFAKGFNSREIFTSRGPSKTGLGHMILAWLLKVLVEEGGVPSASLFNSTAALKFKDSFGDRGSRTPEQENNLKMLASWYDSGSTRVPFELKNKLPWVFDAKTNPMVAKANKVVDEVDDLAFDAISRGSDSIKEFTNSLMENIGSFLSRVATQEVPENINEWIEGAKYERTVSVPFIGKKIEELLKRMIGHPSLKVPGESRWLALKSNHEEEGSSSILSTTLRDWGEFLLSDEVGLEKQGVEFHDRPKEYADILISNIIEPSLINEASDGQILSYTESAVKNLTGDIHFRVPVVKAGGGSSKALATTNDKQPYLNVVYLSGDKVTSDKNRKGIDLKAGNAYDLVVGPGSTKESSSSASMEDKDHDEGYRNIKFTGYVFKVDDGRRVIDLDEARLSQSEIPKFLEFAANNYASRFLDKREQALSSTGLDDEKINSILEAQDADLYQEELDSRKDPVWEYQMANLLKGKSLKEVQDILHKINKSKEGNLAKAMHRQFGSVLEKDVNGGYRVRPSLSQEVLTEHPNSMYKDLTDERVGKTIEALTKDLPSIKDMDLESARNQKEIFDMVKDSKEVAEKFLNYTLHTDATLASKKNGTLNALHGMVMDSNYDKALKEALIENGMSDLLEDLGKGNLAKIRAGHNWDDINKMIQRANKEQSKVAPAAYAEAWEKAKESDPETFNKLFVPDKGISVKSRLSSEELKDLLEIMGNSDPSLMSDEEFSNVMVKEDVGGIPSVSVREETKDGNSVNIRVLQQLVKHLSDVYPEEVRSTLEEEGLTEDFISKDTSGKGPTKYKLRTDAKVSDFKEFMNNHRKPGQIGHVLDPTGTAGASIGAKASRYRVRAPRKSKNIKDKGTSTGLTRNTIHNHLDGLLDKFKDRLETSVDAARLVTEGKGISKALQGSKALTHSQRNIKDITAEIKKVLRHSDNVLQDLKVRQEEETTPDSRRTDYSDLETRVSKKKKDLTSWIHRSVNDNIAFDLNTQKEILDIVNQLISGLGEKGEISDKYLNQEENIKALKELAQVKPKRAR